MNTSNCVTVVRWDRLRHDDSWCGFEGNVRSEHTPKKRVVFNELLFHEHIYQWRTLCRWSHKVSPLLVNAQASIPIAAVEFQNWDKETTKEHFMKEFKNGEIHDNENERMGMCDCN